MAQDIIHNIINPITENNPCGIELKENEDLFNTFKDLKEYRRDLRRQEKKHEQNGEFFINKEGWEKVKDETLELLNHSKNIELLIWLLESLVRLEGFNGLLNGIEILSTLLEKYTTGLYPKIEAEDIESHILPISALCGKLEIGTIIMPIYHSALVKDKDGIFYNTLDIRKYTDTSQIKLQYCNQDFEENNEFKKLVNSVDMDYHLQLANVIKNLKDRIAQLNLIISNVYGSNAPSIKILIETLESCSSLFKVIDSRIVSKKTNQDINNNESDSALKEKENLGNREDYIKKLQEVIKYFEQYESYSPVRYLLIRALKWSELSLAEIIYEVSPNSYEEIDKIVDFKKKSVKNTDCDTEDSLYNND